MTNPSEYAIPPNPKTKPPPKYVAARAKAPRTNPNFFKLCNIGYNVPGLIS